MLLLYACTIYDQKSNPAELLLIKLGEEKMFHPHVAVQKVCVCCGLFLTLFFTLFILTFVSVCFVFFKFHEKFICVFC